MTGNKGIFPSVGRAGLSLLNRCRNGWCSRWCNEVKNVLRASNARAATASDEMGGFVNLRQNKELCG